MSLLWADGFDHYGNANAAINFGQYGASGDGQIGLTTDPTYVRTGSAALTVGVGTNSGPGWVWHDFGGNRNAAGMGAALYLEQSAGWGIYFGRANKANLFVWIDADGSVNASRSYWDGYFLGKSAPGVFHFSTYNYVEAFVIISTTVGRVIVRINGQVVLDLSNVNTDDREDGLLQQIGFGKTIYNSTHPLFAVDDFVIWDATGDMNNTFIGDIRCRTLFPTNNGADQDWQPNNAPAWGELDTVPLDQNNHFVASNNVGDVSTFDMGDVPPNTAYVAGVQLMAALSKTDAGECSTNASVISAGVVADVPDIAQSTAPVYYPTTIEKDPATGAYWSRAAVNAMQARLERKS